MEGSRSPDCLPDIVDCAEIICPTCFESFSIALPGPGDWPCSLDYDGEICCRPMVVNCREEAGRWEVRAHGLDA
jgi:hypothetical protein